MAEQHDLFDDIIDISKGFTALKDPFNGLENQLMGTDDGPQWNPADYKERPRGNTIPCLECIHKGSSCTACKEVCPVNSIEIEDGAIDILDTCRKCGLCVAACPTEALNSPKIRPKTLYDKIAGAATSHTTAYVACTRALRRMPHENEVVVACIGDITPEVWFSILADFNNVSVYLPLDICERCKTSTGEEALGNAIAQAEEWAGRGLGLEVDEKSLKCKKRREYERKEFMDNMMRTTGLTVSKLNPAAAAVASVTQKLKAHSDRISQLERTLNAACGSTNFKRRRKLTQGRQLLLSTLQQHPNLADNIEISIPQCDFEKCTMCGDCVDVLNAACGSTNFKRRRKLTQGRQLLLSTLQQHPNLADNIEISIPQCDFEKCTMCGDCVDVCPTNATDMVGTGKFIVEPEYCVSCGLCARICPDHALTMVSCPGEKLVVPDPDAERRAADAAKAHEEAEKLKKDAKKTVSRVLDQVEKLVE